MTPGNILFIYLSYHETIKTEEVLDKLMPLIQSRDLKE